MPWAIQSGIQDPASPPTASNPCEAPGWSGAEFEDGKKPEARGWTLTQVRELGGKRADSLQSGAEHEAGRFSGLPLPGVYSPIPNCSDCILNQEVRELGTGKMGQ